MPRFYFEQEPDETPQKNQPPAPSEPNGEPGFGTDGGEPPENPPKKAGEEWFGNLRPVSAGETSGTKKEPDAPLGQNEAFELLSRGNSRPGTEPKAKNTGFRKISQRLNGFGKQTEDDSDDRSLFRYGTAEPNPNRLKKGQLKRTAELILRPSALYDRIPEAWWPASLLMCAGFFGLFFLTVALDWYKAGMMNSGRLWLFVLIGLLSGACLGMLFAAGATALARIEKQTQRRSFRFLAPLAGTVILPGCLLLIGILIGLIFSVPVSMSIGVMALLWWLCQVSELLKALFGNVFFRNLTFVTLYGFTVFLWLTTMFRLK